MKQMGAHHYNRELGLVTKLCRELTKFGLNVGMSDARPAAMVSTPGEYPLWITLDESIEFFVWSQTKHQHPVTDLPGAAAVISEHVKAMRSGPGDVS